MSITSSVADIVPVSIYNVLRGEHKEVAALINMLTASPKSATVRDPGCKKLEKELLSHAKAEQATVYERLKEKTDKKDMVKHAKEEHAGVEDLVKELVGQDVETDGWEATLLSLKASVEHHVKEEENTLFEEMKRVFTDKDEEAIGKAFLDAKKKEMELRDKS